MMNDNRDRKIEVSFSTKTFETVHGKKGRRQYHLNRDVVFDGGPVVLVQFTVPRYWG